MNHYLPATTTGNATDVANTRVFLQQAVDHYPRLAAFSFMLKLPYRETMTDSRALILRFHTEVWQRTGEYSRQRQQAHRHSPPTILRWMWESVGTAECKMVLLMNLDTLGVISNIQLLEHAQQAIGKMLREAWLTATGTDRNGVTSITPMILNCSGRGNFATPFNHLKTQVQTMHAPIVTTRTGMTG